MTPAIHDPDVRDLVTIATTLQLSYVAEGPDPWIGSPFAWIRALPPRKKGKIGEQLIAGWCAAKGLDVVASPDAEADRIIAGRRVEVKFSLLWESGVYVFQQLRDQDYGFAICLGVSPFDAHCWVISKELLGEHVLGKTPQHRGKSGTDTFWIQFRPDECPVWLQPCGGRLADAFKILQGWQRGSGKARRGNS